MNDFSAHFLFLFLWIRHTPLDMHPTPLCRKPSCPQRRLHYQKYSEQMPSDAGVEVVIFWSRLSLSSQVIPIYQVFMPFMPIRLYKRHDLSQNNLPPCFVNMVKKNVLLDFTYIFLYWYPHPQIILSINLKFTVLTISSLSLNKYLGDFLVKWRDWNCPFSFFLQKIS